MGLLVHRRPAAGRAPCRGPTYALACLLLIGQAAGWPAAAAEQGATGADVKAAFLLNFVKFVEWPAAPSGEFVIGVLGDDAVADALRDLAKGKAVGGRPLVARRVLLKDHLAGLQVLFIGASESARLGDVLQRTSGGHVLTVSDLDRFSLQGGVIEFRSERDRVRFDIALGQAERSGLIINSKLLALAKTVHHATKSPGASR
ncbi:MAG: YfiR family protein [Acidobacteriota bacterium]|nr:YfiR family protein [Acidobacteriota bacterium]